MNRAEYQSYLASREWAVLKHRIRQRCFGHCERCVGPYEETHHLTYERVGQEKLEDLQAVCSACHSWLSGRTSIDPQLELFKRDFTPEQIDEIRSRDGGLDAHVRSVLEAMHAGNPIICSFDFCALRGIVPNHRTA